MLIISARAVLAYDRESWLGTEPNVQPTRSDREVVIEYVAHPMAKLYVSIGPDFSAVYDLAKINEEKAVVQINSADRPVRVRVIEKETQEPVPV